MSEGHTAVEAIDVLEGNKERKSFESQGQERDLKIAVLGYPYIIYDPYVSVNMIQKLRDLNVEVVTADMLTDQELGAQSHKLFKEPFWTFSDQVVKAGYHYYQEGEIDGLIHVTAFGCGPDFMVGKLLNLGAEVEDDISFITLTIDEHTGEAGIVTRLEAFIDMLRLRRKRA